MAPGAQVVNGAERYRSIIMDRMVDIVTVQGPDMVIRYANQSAATASGRALENVVGRPCYEVWQGRSEPCEQCPVRDTFLTAENHSAELRTPDRRRWLAKTSPIFDPDGKVEAVVEIATEITEFQRTQELQVENQMETLRGKYFQSLSQLAGGVAHDFNNLLTAALGNLHLLENTMASKDALAREWISAASASCWEAADLAKQLLFFAGQGHMEMKPCGLGDLLAGMRGLLVGIVGDRAELAMDVGEGVPQVMASPGYVQQLVSILVINAVESMSRKGRIHVGCFVRTFTADELRANRTPERLSAGNYACIEVEDDGNGMSREVADNLFSPFFTTKWIGRGIGLPFLHGIVRSHRGGVFVNTEKGRGTRFLLLFPPLATAGTEPAAPGLEAVRSRLGLPVDVRSPGIAGLRVLVVDDDRNILHTLCSHLASEDCRCTPAEQGAAACTALQHDPAGFDAAVVDMTMPVMDGAETIRALHAVRPDLPVVLCSGYSRQMVEGRTEGMANVLFLQKPFELRALSKALEQAVQGTRAAK